MSTFGARTRADYGWEEWLAIFISEGGGRRLVDEDDLERAFRAGFSSGYSVACGTEPEG